MKSSAILSSTASLIAVLLFAPVFALGTVYALSAMMDGFNLLAGNSWMFQWIMWLNLTTIALGAICYLRFGTPGLRTPVAAAVLMTVLTFSIGGWTLLFDLHGIADQAITDTAPIGNLRRALEQFKSYFPALIFGFSAILLGYTVAAVVSHWRQIRS